MYRKIILTHFHETLLKGCLILVLILFAANVNAQITVNVSNKPIKEILKVIESKSTYRFIYDESLKNLNQVKTLQVRNSAIDKALLILFTNTNINFKLESNNQIILIAGVAKTQVATKDISGIVTDENKSPIIGATVIVKGTSNGTITNINGDYKLTNVSEDAILTFSFIGMKTQEIAVGGKILLNVTLKEDAIGLQEVVAVGYGTIRKSDLTGSVSKVSVDNTSQKPVGSMEQLLQGNASGVQIVQSNGAPGAGLSILIRGANSTSGNQPLIVIDGFPIDSDNKDTNKGSSAASSTPTSALSNINPNDIESIEILKDASSTAIYGSRGANGVVLITTKRGKSGMDKIEFNYRTDVSSIIKKLDVLNSADFMTFANEAAVNSGRTTALYDATAIEENSKQSYNWQDEILRTAISRDYQLGVSGGEEKTKYALFANYSDLQGIVKNTSFKRGGIRLNLDREFSKKITIAFNFNGSRSTSTMTSGGSTQGLTSGSSMLGALYYLPFLKAYNEYGDIDQNIEGNPLTMVNLVKDDYTTSSLISGLVGTYKFNKYLNFRARLGANYSHLLRQNYWPRGTYQGNLMQGYAFQNQTTQFSLLNEFTVNYNRWFKKSNIDAVIGQTYQSWLYDLSAMSQSQFPNDNTTYYSFQSGNATGIPNTLHQEWALASFLCRVNYGLLSKYLFTFTGRADGSSKLGVGQKWSIFPSFALGWNVHKENFMKPVKFIKNLKLRASYGLTGNQNIGIGQTMPYFSVEKVVIGRQITNAYYTGALYNSTLGWESTRQINAGLDLGILNNRVLFEYNFYKKRTSDMLINLSIPVSTGYSSIPMNAAAVENQGMEFDLKVIAIDKKLKWSIAGNISFNRNKVVDMGPLGDNGKMFGPNYLTYATGLNQPLHVVMKGLPIGSFYGYKIDGIYQTQEEVAAGPEASTAKPGDFKFVDISGADGKPDGIINAEDRTIIGNPYPDYIFGITNNISFKDFSLSFFFQGSMGNDLINLNRWRLDALRANANNVSQAAWDGRWTGPGTSNKYPAARLGEDYFNKRFADFIVEDGSYIRLKNVTFSYNLPLGKLKLTKYISNFRLFVTGSNLLTITKYTGYDPEVSANFNNPITSGVDIGSYPNARTISFGLNIVL